MLSRVASATLQEGEARVIRVEVDVHRGLPSFAVVGMADAPAREERERLSAALVACGFEYPLRRIVVNLAPVGLRKAGPEMGLAIAAGLLCASGQLEPGRFERCAFVGELKLSGELSPVADVAKLAAAARAAGSEAIVVPAGQGPEASRAGGIAVYELGRLAEVAAFACGELEPLASGPAPRAEAPWRPPRVPAPRPPSGRPGSPPRADLLSSPQPGAARAARSAEPHLGGDSRPQGGGGDPRRRRGAR